MPASAAAAWCGSYRPQSYDRHGSRIIPVVTIVCNFTKPTEGQPALLSADEATTLFHEFGHGLHSLFRDVHYAGVSGVPRDCGASFAGIHQRTLGLEPEVLKLTMPATTRQAR